MEMQSYIKKLLFSLCAMLVALSAEAQHGEYVGGDISMLTAYEENSSGYLDGDGNKIDDLIKWLVADCGWNSFRVRLFVNPSDTKHEGVIQNLDYVKKLGKRIKDAGAKFMLDFHYSDTWVDASHIQAPASWSDCTTAEQKAARLSQYTRETLQSLKAAGATPDLVQVGNEIMYGFVGIKVAPYETSGTDWNGYIKVLKAGCEAVRSECPQAKIIVHTDRPGNAQYNKYYYSKLNAAGVDYDIIGLSYYPFWHGTLASLKSALTNLKSDFPDKKVQIVETAYNYQYWPSEGVNYDTRNTWPCSVDGQYNFIKDLVSGLASHDNVNGLFYWFPEELGNGDYVDWNSKKGLVIDPWLNRGLWWENATTTGHWPLKASQGMVHYLFKDFLAPKAQGWPENYDGVMLQGFYWDSYADTQWKNLESQADELSQYFNLIWVPQSGYCNTLTNQMGYSDIWWLDHKSAFGSEAELRSMIKTFRQKGLGTIADVVINHKNGNKSWTDFPDESVVGQNTGKTYQLKWGSDCSPYICRTDECVKAGFAATGAADTGDDFDGARDLDHTNATVQGNIKVYLDYLLNELGYEGFRYDMVKGYAPKYVGMYNTASTPTYSVGECWDGYSTVTSWIEGTRQNGKIQSAAFDFPFRDLLKQAIENSNWGKLNESMLATSTTYNRYAVTFVDNHDTGSSGKGGANPLYKDVEAANAFLLAMPGTPCVFLNHWKAYKATIKKLIALRHLLGIHNQSVILNKGTLAGGYTVTVQGTKGNAMLVLGSAVPQNTTGYKLAMEGIDYKYYVSEGIDISSLDNIKDEGNGFKAPDFCKVEEGETCAFFEAPANWTGEIKCWCWDKANGKNYTGGTWPGAKCVNIGKTADGKSVWKWTCTTTFDASQPMIIFSNNGSPQTADLTFTNGGYYNSVGQQGTVTGIENITTTENVKQVWHTIDGKRIAKPERKGVYILNGKKVVAP